MSSIQKQIEYNATNDKSSNIHYNIPNKQKIYSKTFMRVKTMNLSKLLDKQ